MAKGKSKEKIVEWLDSIIALHKKQYIVVDGVVLDLVDFRVDKVIQIADAHLIASALGKKPKFAKRNSERYPYESYFNYRGYKFFYVMSEEEYEDCCK